MHKRTHCSLANRLVSLLLLPAFPLIVEGSRYEFHPKPVSHYITIFTRNVSSLI